MGKLSYFTQDGLQRLQAELHEYKTKGRAMIASQLEEARSKGDLSENAEYDAAKEAQGILEMKIAKLEQVLSNSRVMSEENVDNSKVHILSKVRIKNKTHGKEFSYMLVSEEEADLKTGKISIDSPIGRGLLGKKVGDVATVVAPSGSLAFEVIEIC